jgi:iron complex transport system ATP-binding protein
MNNFRVDNLSVSLSGKTIIDGLCCTFPTGRLIGLIGPNGAGKSTLLRAFLKLNAAIGSVLFDHQEMLSLSSAKRSRYLSYLPQEREIAWAMSVEAIVRLGLSSEPPLHSRQARSEDAIINEAISQLELETLRHRQVTSLSGGELARVLIARLLAQDTPVILADEPLAGLDPEHQIKVMRLFKQLAQSGKTVLTSIHDLTQAALWCDHLVLIDHGEIHAEGAPKDVLTVENLRKIYRIEAEVEESNGRLFITPIDISK